MTDEIKKSKLVHEKEGLIGIATILLASGAGILLKYADIDPISWEKILLGLLFIAIGFLILFLRGYLKLNRWAHYDLICDNTIIQRFVSWMESKRK